MRRFLFLAIVACTASTADAQWCPNCRPYVPPPQQWVYQPTQWQRVPIGPPVEMQRTVELVGRRSMLFPWYTHWGYETRVRPVTYRQPPMLMQPVVQRQPPVVRQREPARQSPPPESTFSQKVQWRKPRD